MDEICSAYLLAVKSVEVKIVLFHTFLHYFLMCVLFRWAAEKLKKDKQIFSFKKRVLLFWPLLHKYLIDYQILKDGGSFNAAYVSMKPLYRLVFF